MDTNELIEQARVRFNHAASRRILREKYEAKMLFAWNGGMFRACPEMITFLSLYGEEEIVMPDLYNTPTKFRANDVCNIMKSKWQEQMNAWIDEYEKINQQR